MHPKGALYGPTKFLHAGLNRLLVRKSNSRYPRRRPDILYLKRAYCPSQALPPGENVILLVVEDLLFLSKIQQTAQAVQVLAEPVDPARIGERAAQAGVQAVVVDLNHRTANAVEVVRQLKSETGTRGVRVVGFLSHVQVELAAAARGAGCDLVLPRSAFSQRLPQLLRELGGSEGGTGSAP